jgi:hypothetical protein
MRATTLSSAILVAGVLSSWARSALAYTPATDTVAAPAPQTASTAPASDAPVGPPRERYSVDTVASWRGFLFYPSTPKPGTFRFALGANYDAIDPAVMYGMSLRLPQLTVDAVDWLGKGWSIKGHLNTMIVVNELLFGVGYTMRSRPWSLEISASVGMYLGTLGSIFGDTGEGVAGFNALFIAPQYRPELTIGYDFGKIAVSLRGSLLLMGPERTKVGGVWGGFDNSNLFAGHSEMLYVENTTRRGSVWYFGAGAMTTRAYYAMWLLFPDSPGLYTYPRITVGYEY